MSHLGIFLRKQVAPMAAKTKTDILLSPLRQGIVVDVPTPTTSDLSDESHPTLVRVSSGLSFSDDDDEDWKRELAIATSPNRKYRYKQVELAHQSPPPPPPPPLSAVHEIPSGDSLASESPSKQHKRASSSGVLCTYDIPSPSIEVARRRTFSEVSTAKRNLAHETSHRRLQSYTKVDLQEVSGLQDSVDLQAIQSPQLVHRKGTESSHSSSSHGRPPSSLANGSSFKCDLDALKKKLNHRRKKYGIFHVRAGLVWNQIGNYHFRTHNLENALAAYREAIECRDGSSPDPVEHEHVASAYYNIGTVLCNTGRPEQSITPLRKSEQMRCACELAMGRDPDTCLAVADSRHQLGLALSLVEEHEEALFFLHKALASRKQMAGRKSVVVAVSKDVIANVYFMLGNFEKAIHYHQQALSIKKAGLPSNSPAVLASMKSIGAVQEASGDYSGAILSYEAVAKQQEKHIRQLTSELPDMHPHRLYLAREIGDTFQQIARAQFTQNNFVPNDAVKLAVRQAISFYRKAGVDDSSPTMIALGLFVS